MQRNLFGQTNNMMNHVSRVKTGDILFLHNLSTQIIEGPFFAASAGSENIEADAWNGRFPQQVRVEQKGKISKINKNSFDKFGLRYTKDDRFFDFQIPTEIGRKLFEEMGFKIDLVNKKIENYEPLDNTDIDFRLRFAAKYRCEDGHYVRSISETLIDNWLFAHNIVHAYEKKIPGENMMCDFYLRDKNNHDFYIEFWGLENNEKYLKRKKEKLNIYSSRNLKLINIENVNIQNLDDYLGDLFKDFLK